MIFLTFNKIQMCFDERLQLNLFHYFEDLISNFELAVEIRNGVFSIHTILNRAKMFQNEIQGCIFYNILICACFKLRHSLNLSQQTS